MLGSLTLSDVLSLEYKTKLSTEMKLSRQVVKGISKVISINIGRDMVHSSVNMVHLSLDSKEAVVFIVKL